MNIKNLMRKYVSFGPSDVPARKTLNIDVDNKIEPQVVVTSLVIYFSIMVSGYFLAKDVPVFTPLIEFMGLVGAIILIVQIRKLIKKRGEPHLDPHLGRSIG